MSDSRYSSRDQVFRAGVFALPVLPMALVGPIYGSGEVDFGWSGLVGFWLLGVVIYLGLIVVHEMAHAIVGFSVGINIAEVTIGHWRKILEFKIGNTLLRIRAIPDSGYVVPKPSLHLFSASRFVPFVSAGVGAEILALSVIGFAVRVPETGLPTLGDFTAAYFRLSAFYFGGLQILFSVWPNHASADGQRLANDGRVLLQFWQRRHSRKADRENLAALQRVDALAQNRGFSAALPEALLLAEKTPENTGLARWIAVASAETGDTEKALALFQQSLERPGITPPEKAEILDGLACLPLYYGRSDLLENARGWIDGAIACAPYAITLKGTLGGVLVEQGRLDEGTEVLREVLRKSDDRLDHAISLAFLAKAADAAGNRPEAALLIAKAQAIAPDQRVVRRVAAAIGTARTA